MIGLLVGHVIYATVLGIMIGVLLALLMLVRRTKKATFNRYAGKAGSAEVALSMLPKQWTYTAAIAANRQMDCVHRAIGPGGLVLIGDGDPARIKPMLASEVRKHERVSYGVKAIAAGDGRRQGPGADEQAHRPHPQAAQDPAAQPGHRPEEPAAGAGRDPAGDADPEGPMPTSARQAKGSRQAMRGR